jgi:hypothetical protein
MFLGSPAPVKRRRLNMIGENPSLPVIVNDPKRLGKLVAEKRKREEAKDAKENKKKLKLAASQARQAKSNAKVATQREEQPVSSLLVKLGFKEDDRKKTTLSELKAFMKKNKLKYDHGKSSRATVMSRLLRRLLNPPPAGGWHGVDASDRKESEHDNENEDGVTSGDDDGDGNDGSESDAPVASSEAPPSALVSSSVSRSDRAPRIRRAPSFFGQVRSDLSI